MHVCVCLYVRMCVCILIWKTIINSCILYRIWPGVTREAGNAYSSGAPRSTSFARSSYIVLGVLWLYLNILLMLSV